MEKILTGSHMDNRLVLSGDEAEAHCLFLGARLMPLLGVEPGSDYQELDARGVIDLCGWWFYNSYDLPEYGTDEFEKLYTQMGYPKWDEPEVEREDYATSGAYEIGWRVLLPWALEELEEVNLAQAYTFIEDSFNEISETEFFGWDGFAMIAHATNKAFERYGISKRFWFEEAIDSYNTLTEYDEDAKLNTQHINKLHNLFDEAENAAAANDGYDHVRLLFKGEYDLENIQ